MRTHARHSRGERTQSSLEEGDERARTYQLALVEDIEEAFEEEAEEICRVRCPDCSRPIALLVDDDVLPEHAVCPTLWNPFGLTVCPGSGRLAQDAAPADGPLEDIPQDGSALLTLPAGLDWRTQPFSHVGGPGSQPGRAVPYQRAA
jgi:hypothetical protein